MKNRAILIATLAFLAAAEANALVIGVNPATQTVAPGDPVSVDIDISGLGVGTAPSVGEFDLDVMFDPTLLSYTGALFGDAVLGDQLDLFGFGSLIDVIDNGAGVVNLYELSFDSVSDLNDLQSDAFTLVTVSFDALAVGTSNLMLSLNTLGDALGDPVTATLEDGSITVNEREGVPEPITLGLLAIGLGRLSLRRRQNA